MSRQLKISPSSPSNLLGNLANRLSNHIGRKFYILSSSGDWGLNKGNTGFNIWYSYFNMIGWIIIINIIIIMTWHRDMTRQQRWIQIMDQNWILKIKVLCVKDMTSLSEEIGVKSAGWGNISRRELEGIVLQMCSGRWEVGIKGSWGDSEKVTQCHNHYD